MNSLNTLNSLSPGERAVIAGIRTAGEDRRRLRELGMTDGTSVECILKRSGIGAYLIKGTLIALRECDTRMIQTALRAESQSVPEGSCAVWL